MFGMFLDEFKMHKDNTGCTGGAMIFLGGARMAKFLDFPKCGIGVAPKVAPRAPSYGSVTVGPMVP